MKIGTKNNHGKHLPDINRIKIHFFAPLAQLKKAFTKKNQPDCIANMISKCRIPAKTIDSEKNGNGN